MGIVPLITLAISHVRAVGTSLMVKRILGILTSSLSLRRMKSFVAIHVLKIGRKQRYQKELSMSEILLQGIEHPDSLSTDYALIY